MYLNEKLPQKSYYHVAHLVESPKVGDNFCGWPDDQAAVSNQLPCNAIYRGTDTKSFHTVLEWDKRA